MERLRHRMHSTWGALALFLLLAIGSDIDWIKAAGWVGAATASAYLTFIKRRMKCVHADAATADKPNLPSPLKVLATNSLFSFGLIFLLDWVAVPLLTFMSLGAVLLSVFRIKPPQGERRIGFFKAAIYGAAALVAFQINETHHTHDRANAEQIIKGLEAYQQKFGVYPVKLNALVPSFMRTIPRGYYGPYMYWLGADGTYRLYYVQTAPGWQCFYTSGKQVWQCLAD